MRKLLFIVLILATCFILVACSADNIERDTEYRAKVVASTDDSYKDEASGKYYSTQIPITTSLFIPQTKITIYDRQKMSYNTLVRLFRSCRILNTQ